MSDGLNQNESAVLPDWADCDLFCIQDYAGTGAAACGWRGRFCDVKFNSEMKRVCPRCGFPTLLRIPSSQSGGPKA